MKVTIYELLGMVKDGKAPEVIKYDGLIYYKEIDGYYTTNELKLKLSIMNNLNDEVEIIEPQEHKIPEKLESYISCGWAGTCKDLKREDLFNDLKKMGSKINEILDYLVMQIER